VSTAADEEVRMNRQTLEFITSNRLYSLDEQTRLAAADVASIDFPPAAKEVKAHWIKLDDPADQARYHTGVGSDGTVYGLVGWHVTTKDLPRWFWATFEHVDNETRWPAEHPSFFAGWSERPIDRFACENEAPDCAKIPAGIGLEGTKWENYRLKATQIDWVDSVGRPTVVVNSKIEGGFIQSNSSCISCHALAMIGEGPIPMPFSIINPDVPVDPLGRVANFVGVVDSDDRRPVHCYEQAPCIAIGLQQRHRGVLRLIPFRGVRLEPCGAILCIRGPGERQCGTSGDSDCKQSRHVDFLPRVCP
jgi:hypothetical protein